MLARPCSGPFAYISAIGTGSNVKTRRRCARLALALAVAFEDPARAASESQDHPLFAHLVVQARSKYTLAHQALLEGSFASAPANSPAAPALALPAPPAHPPPPARSEQVLSQELAPDPAAAPPPRPVAVGSSEPWMDDVRNDPFAELRKFSDGQTWPFCNACNCWSDSAHIQSKRHLKQLAHANYPQPPQAATTAQAARQVHAAPQTPAGAQWQSSSCGVRAHPAPPPPTAEDIYNWSAPWLHFDWKTVRSLDENFLDVGMVEV